MYSFQLLMPIDGSPTPLQVVYPSHEDSDDRLATSLEQLVEAYNVRVPPSRLLFICPTGIEKRIERSFNNRKGQFEGRLISTSHVIVAPYDERGKLDKDRIIPLNGHADTNWQVDDCFLKQLGDRAVAEIFNDTKTVLHAPHGYLFRHLSGREEDIFVRAGNLLREPSCLAVFNHLLLRKLPPNCSLVYIDSFTILSFALGLQSLVGYFRRLGRSVSAFAIENIHSYELTSEFRIPNEAIYLVLISASTSGGFADKLVEEKKAIRNRIVHLLGAGPPESDLRDSCIYFWERPRPSRPISGASQQNALIEIGTEEFLVAQGPPRPVRITRDHVNLDGARKLHNPFYREALKFDEPAPVPGGAYSTFSVSTEPGDSKCSPMRQWVKDRLVHELPASVRTLVPVDDDMSAEVASWLRKALGSHVVKKSFAEFKNSECKAPAASGSVVVVAYQDPGLERLRESSVELRRMEDVHSLHRHYVVGYAFPSSRAEHSRLKDDLRRGPNGSKYGWSEYLVLPVGADTLHESLVPSDASFGTEEIEQRREELGRELADALIARETRSEVRSDDLFLPRTNGDPLVLRHGSVFFDPPTPDVSQIAVHAMVSAAMQAAREPGVPSDLNSAPPNPGFDDNPFVRSVLDPSMFARYSDGILQASLLRTARRSELDYSASDLSRQFASVCDYILDSRDHDVGEAALEFVHALATEKVSLRSEDRDWLRKKICCVPVLDSFWGLLRQEPRRPFKLKVLTKRGRLMPGVEIDDRDALYRVMEER